MNSKEDYLIFHLNQYNSINNSFSNISDSEDDIEGLIGDLESLKEKPYNLSNCDLGITKPDTITKCDNYVINPNKETNERHEKSTQEKENQNITQMLHCETKDDLNKGGEGPTKNISDKESQNKKIKKGRRPKRNGNERYPWSDDEINMRTKYASDNIINKVRIKFIESNRNLINLVLKYELCQKHSNKIMLLGKLGKEITGQINMEKFKGYLFNSSIGDMYNNENISGKYNHYSLSDNQKCVRYVSDPVNNMPLTNFFLKMKGETAYELFVTPDFQSFKSCLEKLEPNLFNGKISGSLEETLKKFTNFEKEKENMLHKGEEKEYLECLTEKANIFLDYYKAGKGRKRRMN